MNNSYKEHMDLINQNILGHFEFLPGKLGVDLIEINDVIIINCELNSSMFNIVFGLPNCQNFLDSIEKIKQIFKHKSFTWWCSHYNHEFNKTMLDSRFIIETKEHAMICDLSKQNQNSLYQKTELIIEQVNSNKSLQDFISVIESYDDCTRIFYEKLSLKDLQSKEKLFVGYYKEAPVSIGILFFSDNNTTGIYSLITKDEFQKKALEQI